MNIEGKGQIEGMTGECLTRDCVHYKVKYKIIPPMVSLKKVEGDDR